MVKRHLDPADGFADSYAVELLYADRPELSAHPLEEHLRRHSPTLERATPVEAPSQEEPSSTESFLFSAPHPLDPALPGPRWRIALAATFDAGRLAASAAQTWWWEEGRQILERCRFAVVVVDQNAAQLPHRIRLQLFQRIVVGVLEAYPALAIHWRRSQHLVSPQELIETALADDYSNPLPGAVNVRFFRIDKPGGEEWLMDTLGLAALGLPDLQCHFRGLEPNDVSRVLYTTACYLYDHGPVIKNGDTVAGPREYDSWICQLEEAIAEPPRPVLDLDPGFPFAGGENEDAHVLPTGRD